MGGKNRQAYHVRAGHIGDMTFRSNTESERDVLQEIRRFIAPKVGSKGKCADCGCMLRSGNKHALCAPCERRFLKCGTLTEIKKYFEGSRA
jgi:hypothetical protein